MQMEIRHFPDLVELSRNAAGYIADLARGTVKEKGLFTLVLSGGHTPQTLYRLLSAPPFREVVPWSDTYVFWGDERCVPKDDPHSNYFMAMNFLLSRVAIPPGNIHPIPVEIDPPDRAAAEYERGLLEFFGHADGSAPEAAPSFDLVLLGVGSDGHTASLFPGDPALGHTNRWVVAVEGLQADPPIPRVTLTLPIINAARCVLFLVAGTRKKPVVQAIWANPKEAGRLYPAALVRALGKVVWFSDWQSEPS
jgi:6-phosphogluconolactonase